SPVRRSPVTTGVTGPTGAPRASAAARALSVASEERATRSRSRARRRPTSSAATVRTVRRERLRVRASWRERRIRRTTYQVTPSARRVPTATTPSPASRIVPSTSANVSIAASSTSRWSHGTTKRGGTGRRRTRPVSDHRGAEQQPQRVRDGGGAVADRELAQGATHRRCPGQDTDDRAGDEQRDA